MDGGRSEHSASDAGEGGVVEDIINFKNEMSTKLDTKKMKKQREMDEPNLKAQTEAVHDVLDTKAMEKSIEDFKHCPAS